MPAAATKNVTGYLTDISAAEIDGAFLRFNPDPDFIIATGGTVAVGTQADGKPGEVVTPVAQDGSFSAPIIAADNASWTITVTIDGPNVETPLPSFVIEPPPASGTGDVTIDTLVKSAPSGGTPALVAAIRSMQDYDDSVAPTTGQVIKWNGTKYAPADESGGGTGTGLPTGGSAGQVLTKNSSTDGDAGWEPLPTSLTQSQADSRYAPLTSGLPILAWNGVAYPAKPAGVTNAIFVGDPTHDPGSGSVDGDLWLQPAAAS